MPALTAGVAVIGGSGFYRFLDDVEEISVETPYGPTSAPVAVGRVGGCDVAFVARHGPGHGLAPHQVPYRANLWALRSLGVRRVIAPCACGSLRADLVPGDLVVLDQLVDRTWGRPDTFVEGPGVEHVAFADPYCAELSSTLARVASSGGWPDGKVVPAGAVVVIQGPRFSTRAESRFYAAAGLDVINMTQYPEAYLARELGLCYAGLALVTDHDAGVDGRPDIEAVSMEAALAVMAANVDRTRHLLAAAVPAIPADPACSCRRGGCASLTQWVPTN